MRFVQRLQGDHRSGGSNDLGLRLAEVFQQGQLLSLFRCQLRLGVAAGCDVALDFGRRRRLEDVQIIGVVIRHHHPLGHVLVIAIVIAKVELEVQLAAGLVELRIELVQRLARNKLIDLHRRQRLRRRHHPGDVVRLHQSQPGGAVAGVDNRQHMRLQQCLRRRERFCQRF